MTAGQDDITIEQGATFSTTITITDPVTGAVIDVSGWTFRGKVRSTYSSTTVQASFTFDTSLGATGVVTATISAANTALIAVPAATSFVRTIHKYIYDIEGVKVDTSVVRVVEGIAYISPEVTY